MPDLFHNLMTSLPLTISTLLNIVWATGTLQTSMVYSSRELIDNLKFPSPSQKAIETPSCSNDTYIMETVLNLDVYNKHKLPDPQGVDVKVEFWIQVSLDEAI